MNFVYYVEIRHTPKYKNGAYRKSYLPFTARSPQNALRQAAQYCIDNDINAVGYDATWDGIPVNAKARFKWVKERRLAEEEAQLNAVNALVNYDPSAVLEDYADS